MNVSLWRQRNFMLLWSGQLVSWLGTEVSGIVMPLGVLALTGSPAQAGTVAAIRGLVYVIWAIPADIAIDRLDRKLVMFVANLGRFAALPCVVTNEQFPAAALIPAAIRGRVSSLTRLVVLGAHSFGFFSTGLLLQGGGSTWAVAALSCVLVVLLLAMAVNAKSARV